MHIPNTKVVDHFVKCGEIKDKRMYGNGVKAFVLGVCKLGTYWTMYVFLGLRVCVCVWK